MKWILVSAAALSLVIATPALASPAPDAGRHADRAPIQLAQNMDHGKRDRDTNRDRSRDRTHQAAPAAKAAPARKPAPMRKAAPARKPAPRMATQPRKPAPRKAAPTRRAAPVMRTQRRHEAQQQRYDWRKYQPGKAPPTMKRRQRFDIHGWQRNFRAERRYHWRPYQRPRGWYYRRWVFGMILPVLFWSQDYWITDYWQFGLPNPPYGYVWVRYGDDAVLVNVRSGYILQVVYGLFY